MSDVRYSDALAVSGGGEGMERKGFSCQLKKLLYLGTDWTESLILHHLI